MFVVVQVSSVMKDGLGAAKTGITRLAKTLAKIPDSRIGLISYSSEYKKLEELGRPNEVARELDRLKIDEDATETRMLDGVRVAIDLLRESVGKRKMVVVFSDGIDAAGTKDSYEQVGKSARCRRRFGDDWLRTVRSGTAPQPDRDVESGGLDGPRQQKRRNIPHHFEQLVDGSCRRMWCGLV